MMIHGGNFLANAAVNVQPDETRPTTDVKYPDRILLPILNGKVPKKYC